MMAGIFGRMGMIVSGKFTAVDGRTQDITGTSRFGLWESFLFNLIMRVRRWGRGE